MTLKEQENVDDHITQLKAHIGVLERELACAEAVIEDLSDHGSAAERMKLLKELRAEIERLNVENWHLKTYAGRAADALEEVKPNGIQYYQKIIAELRKAAE